MSKFKLNFVADSLKNSDMKAFNEKEIADSLQSARQYPSVCPFAALVNIFDGNKAGYSYTCDDVETIKNYCDKYLDSFCEELA